jgi:translation initiation factor 1
VHGGPAISRPCVAGYRSLMAKRNRDLVYSTSDGDLRRARDPRKVIRSDGGRVKVRREVAGRRGKGVTTISNVALDEAGLRQLAGKLKKRCGVGGSVKDGVIELQGDHRDVVMDVLRAEGYDAVLAGG